MESNDAFVFKKSGSFYFSGLSYAVCQASLADLTDSSGIVFGFVM